MAKKKPKSREQEIFNARMKKQLDIYGYFNGQFDAGTEVESLESDPKLENVIKHALKTIMRGKAEPALVKIIKRQILQAENGSVKSAEFLFDRAYGKPQQTLHVDTPPAVNIQHTVISIDEAKNLKE